MPFRLKLGIALSLILHLGLLALLTWLPKGTHRPPIWLSAQGGVVWLNFNPGGSGTGGAGGLGAPKDAPKAADQAAALPTPLKTPKILPAVTKKKDAVTVKAPIEKKQVPATSPQETEGKKVAAPPKNPAPWQGPGEGDEAGAKTGPGKGEGTGLGTGKGSGSGPGEGPGGVGPPGTGNGETGGAGSSVLNQIRRKILRAKRYPRLAREAGQEGVAGLMFQIASDGSVQVQLASSSGYPALDAEAVATVRRAAPFPFYPNPIRFTLKFSLKDDR